MDSDTHHYQQNMINSGMYGDEILSRFMSNSAGGDNSISYVQNLAQIRGNESQLMNIKKQELQQMMYQNLAQSQDIGYNNSLIDSSSGDRVDGSMAMAPATNLLRQCCSPAGFFEHVNINNGYSMIGSIDKFRPANGSVPDSSSTNRLKSPMAFSTGSHSSSRLPSRMIETEGKSMAHNNGGFGEAHKKAAGYVASFPVGSWNESSMLTDQMISLENQNERDIHTPTGLTHQLSLPTSSTELYVMTNLLQFQDNVPLRSRAKRGGATHPRSIAERVYKYLCLFHVKVRRTRISERIRKLEDLVPNMDKQTSISDMLDLAVDYIKDLQTQVETLADHHAKCTCANKKQLYT